MLVMHLLITQKYMYIVINTAAHFLAYKMNFKFKQQQQQQKKNSVKFILTGVQLNVNF